MNQIDSSKGFGMILHTGYIYSKIRAYITPMVKAVQLSKWKRNDHRLSSPRNQSEINQHRGDGRHTMNNPIQINVCSICRAAFRRKCLDSLRSHTTSHVVLCAVVSPVCTITEDPMQPGHYLPTRDKGQ